MFLKTFFIVIWRYFELSVVVNFLIKISQIKFQRFRQQKSMVVCSENWNKLFTPKFPHVVLDLKKGLNLLINRIFAGVSPK